MEGFVKVIVWIVFVAVIAVVNGKAFSTKKADGQVVVETKKDAQLASPIYPED